MFVQLAVEMLLHGILRCWLKILAIIAALEGVCYPRLIPRQDKPIELDVTNVNEVSDYFFHFYLETDSLPGMDLEITFPPNLGYNFGAAGTACSARLATQNFKTLTCTSLSSLVILVRVDNLPAGTDYLNTVVIRDITNPSLFTRGSGLFKLRILRGLVNEYDAAYVFSQIAFTAAPSALSSPSISITANNEPNLLGTYTITTNFLSGVIPNGASLRIGIPSELTFDQTKIKVTPTPSLGTAVGMRFYRRWVILTNLAAQTLPTLSLSITNVQNMAYSGTTSAFVLQLRSNGTEQILEGQSIGGVAISPSVIPNSNIQLTSFGVDVSSSPLYIGDTVQLEMSVKIKNTLPDNCAISITLPTEFTTITRCWGLNNVIDLTEASPVSCSFVGGQIRLTNLNGIFKFKQVKVAFQAVLPTPGSGSTLTGFTFSTFVDATFTKMVDTTAQQSIAVSSTAPVPVTFSTGKVSNAITTTFGVSFTVPVAVAAMQAKIYLAPGFSNTNGAAIGCSATKNAVSIGASTCTATINDKNFLEIAFTSPASLGAATVADAWVVTLSLISSQGLKTPLYAGNYFGQVLLYSGTTLVTAGTGYVDIDPPAFTVINIEPYTKDYNHVTVYDFSVYLPFVIDQGQWVVQDLFSSTFFEMVLNYADFGVNLVTAYPNGAIVPCYGIIGLFVYGTTSGKMD